MNKNEKQELARRAVASKHWRWMPGMREEGAGWRCMSVADDGRPTLWADDGGGWVEEHELPNDEPPVPDLDDPATLGCLLALVREAWGDARIAASWSYATGRWMVWSPDHPGRLGDADTEGEALVAALEATQ